MTMQLEETIVLRPTGTDFAADKRWPAESTLDSWHPDPFGRFAERHFFLGHPTSLVRHKGAEGYDAVGPLLAGAPEEPLFASMSPRLTFPGDDLRAVVDSAKAHTPKLVRRLRLPPTARGAEQIRAWWPLDTASGSSPADAEDSQMAPAPRRRHRPHSPRQVLRHTFLTTATALSATAAAVLAWPHH